MEMTTVQTEAVSGGNFVTDVVSMGYYAYQGLRGYVVGVGAAGATLSNYYGQDMTMQIFAAGNMTA